MKLCPVMFDGGDVATCVKGRCMWWRDNECAVVGLYGLMVKLAGQSIDPVFEELVAQVRERERAKQ